MADNAVLSLDDKKADMTVRKGTIGPDVVDTALSTRIPGMFTYDPGFTSTASCESRSPISTATKACCCIAAIHRAAGRTGRLPRNLLPAALRRTARPAAQKKELRHARDAPHDGSRADEPLLHRLSRDAHPMAVMVGTVGALSAFYHDSTDITDPHQRMVASLP